MAYFKCKCDIETQDYCTLYLSLSLIVFHSLCHAIQIKQIWFSNSHIIVPSNGKWLSAEVFASYMISLHTFKPLLSSYLKYSNSS